MQKTKNLIILSILGCLNLDYFYTQLHRPEKYSFLFTSKTVCSHFANKPESLYYLTYFQRETKSSQKSLKIWSNGSILLLCI